MPRPRQVSDEDILHHARACFLEHGPGVSTTVIAERVGLSQAALFKRFGTKGELLKAALLPAVHVDFLELLAQGPSDAPLKAQLEELGQAIGTHFERMIPCMTTLMASGMCKEDIFAEFDVPPPIRTHLAMVAWFERAAGMGLLKAIPEPSIAAMAFLGTLHVRAFMEHVGAPGVKGLQPYVTGVTDIFAHGILEPA